MKKLPNAVKWLIIVAVLAAMAAMTFAVNDRASRVDMPAPDNTFGISTTSPTNEKTPPGCCSHRNREGVFNGRKSPCPS